MRRRAFWLLLALLLEAGGAGLLGCQGGRGADGTAAVRYVCPMRCQEDTTYDQPGRCPVCGMDLVEVKADGTLAMPAPPEPASDVGGR